MSVNNIEHDIGNLYIGVLRMAQICWWKYIDQYHCTPCWDPVSVCVCVCVWGGGGGGGGVQMYACICTYVCERMCERRMYFLQFVALSIAIFEGNIGPPIFYIHQQMDQC